MSDPSCAHTHITPQATVEWLHARTPHEQEHTPHPAFSRWIHTHATTWLTLQDTQVLTTMRQSVKVTDNMEWQLLDMRLPTRKRMKSWLSSNVRQSTAFGIKIGVPRWQSKPANLIGSPSGLPTHPILTSSKLCDHGWCAPSNAVTMGGQVTPNHSRNVCCRPGTTCHSTPSRNWSVRIVFTWCPSTHGVVTDTPNSLDVFVRVCGVYGSIGVVMSIYGVWWVQGHIFNLNYLFLCININLGWFPIIFLCARTREIRFRF